MTLPYAFTYKLNSVATVQAKREDYAVILTHIQKTLGTSGNIHSVYYELDSKQNYHIHGIVFATYVNYRKLAVKGYTSRWRQIYDYAGWESYIKKDQDDESVDPPDDIKLPLKRSLFKAPTQMVPSNGPVERFGAESDQN